MLGYTSGMTNQEKKRRKPENIRKTEYLRVRVSEEQKDVMQRAANQAGITLSAWAVERLLRTAREEVPN
ncbi:MAG: DUF1778 domain-containing protein [Candidatus Portnoybacteria bacterium]|nr:DUF1778 domain-containing protein [Candidatus Portnoybacteria bacterium]